MLKSIYLKRVTMSKERDEIEVRLDNNKCPYCLAELIDSHEEVKKCWVCGLVVSTAKDEDE